MKFLFALVGSDWSVVCTVGMLFIIRYHGTTVAEFENLDNLKYSGR